MTTIRGTSAFDQLMPGVKNLIAACGIFYLGGIIFPDLVIPYLALTPVNVIQQFWVWQLFTYSFLHADFWHLFMNMFVLWMVGPHIENYWGTKKFIIYYFCCVLGAALSQTVVAPYIPAVGASGGIYGLLLAYGFLFPRAVVLLFFVFPLRAIQAVLVIAIITFVSSVQSSGTSIAHFAHFGGMLTGFLYFKVSNWMANPKYYRTTKSL